MEPPTVVIDNGTGYSKMGYAGNLDPSYIIPSTIATSLSKVSVALPYYVFILLSFCRNQTSLRTLILTIILVMRQCHMLNLINWAIFLSLDRSKIGKVLKNSGTSLCTRIFDVNQKSTDSSWLSHQWILQRTENKSQKLCLRRLVLRDSLLVFRQH